MKEKVINHFCHDHPLILTENVGNKETLCYGCRNPVILESAYVCSQKYCPGKPIFHKRCAELPRQISHPSHPEHDLHLNDYQLSGWTCNLCRGNMEGLLGYRCSICDFDIEISCQQLGCIDDLLENKRLRHPCHNHPLTLMRKLPSLFHCDGCGTEDRDMVYVCSTCEFWIHKTCASLPINIILSTNHHHQLFLSFLFPIQHRNFRYFCDVCNKEFDMTCWVYYCGDCRYFAHVKCATSIAATGEMTAAESSSLNAEKNDGSELIQLPVRDISRELITPFIIRNGLEKIPDTKDMPPSVIMPETREIFSVLFNYHNHPLSLALEGPTTDDELMMICDVCVAPVYSPPYYNCNTCNKYFVHSTCYFLPKTLSSDDPQTYVDCPRTHENHKFTLYTGSELSDFSVATCGLCLFDSSGRVYGCEDCKMMIDVKCAALPNTVKHASHQQHKLIMRRKQKEESGSRRQCSCCERGIFNDVDVAYFCTSDGCDFALDFSCVLLPQSIKHEWDKHPLLLTYDASLDHPTDFYCEVCEEEMHPKIWMYHCRECDNSFHPHCLTASNHHRNVKSGRQVWFVHHPHPLTLGPLTLKLRCDACQKYWYRLGGFECASCNYVLCYPCGVMKM